MLNFTKRDGLISHMKMLGDSLFYVKNTRDLVRYDLKTHSSHLLGQTRDAVIAMYVTKGNHIRELDKNEEEKMGGAFEIDEEAKSDDEKYCLTCLDESEHIYILKGDKSSKKISLNLQASIKSLSGIP